MVNKHHKLYHAQCIAEPPNCEMATKNIKNSTLLENVMEDDVMDCKESTDSNYPSNNADVETDYAEL